MREIMGFKDGIEDYLEVGAAAVLSFGPGEDDALRIKSAVRGWTKRAHIMLDMPLINTKPMRLNHMQPCVVRFVAKGHACGFDSRVLLGVNGANRHLCLAWPDKVEIIQMRRHERIDVSSPCVVNLESGDVLLGAVRDLSTGGCCIEAKTGLRVDERFTLSFTLPDGQDIQDVPTLVRNVRRLSQQALYGCEFTALPDLVHDDIAFYITATLEQQRAGRLAAAHVLIADSVIERAWPLHEAIESVGFFAFTATGVLDLFYRLRFAPPAVLLISADQRDAEVPALIQIIHGAAGFENLPIIVYGKGPCTESELSAAGASGCFPDLDDAEAVAQKIGEIISSTAQDAAAAKTAAGQGPMETTRCRH
jgi:c-di-GMP-binding flagellar brake protein YcgR